MDYKKRYKISFKEWCKINGHEDILDLWDYDLNLVDPDDISFGSHQYFYFKCPNGIHESYLKQLNRITSRPYTIYECVKCNSFAYYMINSFGEDAFDMYWNYELNKGIDPWELTYGSKIDIYLNCLDGHKPFKTKPQKVSSYGIRCPECMAMSNTSSLHKKVVEYVNMLFENITYENDISLIPRNPKNNHTMPYDICIEDLKLIIEVHGLQHTNMTNWCDIKAKKNGTTPEEEFAYRQWKDEYKKQYALNNGYKYLAILHDAEAADKYKILIDNKIKEITEAPIKMLPKYRTLN